jgi:hypothetical protein
MHFVKRALVKSSTLKEATQTLTTSDAHSESPVSIRAGQKAFAMIRARQDCFSGLTTSLLIVTC